MKPTLNLDCTLLALLGCFSVVVACDDKTAVTTPAAGGTSTAPPCEAGTERCECYGNGTCNAGLTCASDLCVKFASTAAGGATSTIPSQGGAVAISQGGAVPVFANGGSPAAGGLTGAGGTSSTGGATAATGGTVTTGGIPNTAGGAHSTGGTAASAGTAAAGGTAPGTCTAATNLIAQALLSTSTNWIGGDPTSTLDNPCGVQGVVYAASDKGLDKVAGGSDASIQTPALDTAVGGEARLSPCSVARNACCITGTTSKWPVNGSTTDYTASVWGGYLGVSLNDPGAGGTKRAYQGIAKGFQVTIAGTLNGQVLRLGYTQSATDSCAPFMQMSAVGTVALYFVGADSVASVSCPTWICTPACITPTATATPYDLQLQVVGGDVAGSFDVCITSITPILY